MNEIPAFPIFAKSQNAGTGTAHQIIARGSCEKMRIFFYLIYASENLGNALIDSDIYAILFFFFFLISRLNSYY